MPGPDLRRKFALIHWLARKRLQRAIDESMTRQDTEMAEAQAEEDRHPPPPREEMPAWALAVLSHLAERT